EGLAGLGPEEKDQGVVRGNALVVRVEGDQLGAERAPVGRHQAEKSAVLPDRHHDAHRLHDLAAREISERGRHGWDEFVHPEERADRVLVEDQRHPTHARRSRATSSCPFRLAISSPVCPSPVRSRRSAPFSRSRRTSATSPLNAASWSGVWPFGEPRPSTGAPREIKSRTMAGRRSARGPAAAALIGRLPSPFRETASTSAPASRSISTVAGWAEKDAR